MRFGEDDSKIAQAEQISQVAVEALRDLLELATHLGNAPMSADLVRRECSRALANCSQVVPPPQELSSAVEALKIAAQDCVDACSEKGEITAMGDLRLSNIWALKEALAAIPPSVVATDSATSPKGGDAEDGPRLPREDTTAYPQATEALSATGPTNQADSAFSAAGTGGDNQSKNPGSEGGNEIENKR